jgi:hypothetical protein
MRENELQVVRRVYAKQIVHAARASDPRLEKVLAELRREDFLSAGPWQLMRVPGGYQITPNDDPIYLYQDVPTMTRDDGVIAQGWDSAIGASSVSSRRNFGRFGDGKRRPIND